MADLVKVMLVTCIFQLIRIAPDIQRFSTVVMLKTNYLVKDMCKYLSHTKNIYTFIVPMIMEQFCHLNVSTNTLSGFLFSFSSF